MLTLTEAANKLHCNRTWLRGYCDRAKIPLVPVGKALVIADEDVEKIRLEMLRPTRAKAKKT